MKDYELAKFLSVKFYANFYLYDDWKGFSNDYTNAILNLTQGVCELKSMVNNEIVNMSGKRISEDDRKRVAREKTKCNKLFVQLENLESAYLNKYRALVADIDFSLKDKKLRQEFLAETLSFESLKGIENSLDYFFGILNTYEGMFKEKSKNITEPQPQ